MIAIFVGALTTEVGEGWKFVDEQGEVVDLGRGIHEKGREDYPSLRFWRNKDM
jgi:hypothetical protein